MKALFSIYLYVYSMTSLSGLHRLLTNGPLLLCDAEVLALLCGCSTGGTLELDDTRSTRLEKWNQHCSVCGNEAASRSAENG